VSGRFDSDALVFFGSTGDLAYKQIFPALQGLARDEGLDVPIVGVGRKNWSNEQFKEHTKQSISEHGRFEADAFAALSKLLRYVSGDYNDAATFARLREELQGARKPLYYLAIPPSSFESVTRQLAQSGGARDARVVLEKPFGRDLASAQELNRTLHRSFGEEQIFRIDHYLGKEPVQNMLYTRFANPVFEPLWNRNNVASIQITMAESFGVEDRGSFYDETGALRDVVQNHMLQLLANLTMDPPTGGSCDATRDQKAALLKAVQPLAPADVVRGQYAGYRRVVGVPADSKVETFVAIRLAIDSWRLAGVPVFIRAGKCLPVTATEIFVEFKRPPRETFGEIVPATSSHMRFRISPDIHIGLGVRMKAPGERMVGNDVELSLTREEADDLPPYQRLLGDAMRGTEDLFARQDQVEEQWRIVDPILGDRAPAYPYQPNTWGPEEAQPLIGAHGPWRDPRAA
jgi:glucose-6-phosphate 1-dehydrogenase